MADQTGTQTQDKSKSGLKPQRKPVKRKQLVSIRRGAAETESAEDRTPGSGLFEQRSISAFIGYRLAWSLPVRWHPCRAPGRIL